MKESKTSGWLFRKELSIEKDVGYSGDSQCKRKDQGIGYSDIQDRINPAII